MSITGKTRRFCIVTMIGGVDIIGDLIGELSGDSDWIEIEHPCGFQIRPPNITVNNMMRNSPILAGNSIMLNKRTIMWISEPNSKLLSVYQSERSGILIAHPKAGGLNG